jgi:hypothetical protein
MKMKKISYYFAFISLFLYAKSDSQKTSFLQIPGGAIFKNPKTLIVPEDKAWILTEDTQLKIDRLEINGTIYTRGHLFSVYVGKLFFGPKGVIKTFDQSAHDSTNNQPVPATPPPQIDQKHKCKPGHVGVAGTIGLDGVHDELTDGRKDPQPIKIFAAELEGVAKIEAIGQKGGRGMKGGTGGKGGQGGRGGEADADQGFLGLGSTCDGGPGGVGGKGGQGGNGGIGGTGGPAPQVEFSVANLRSPQIFSQNITLREGDGGDGGLVGDGGDGGTGGAGGDSDRGKPITESFWGSKANAGPTGGVGEKGDPGIKTGDIGAHGPVPPDENRVLAHHLALENHRKAIFVEWQEFHWRRQLLAHVQDSFRLIQKKIFTREELKNGLDEDKAIFAELDQKQLKRIIEVWQKAYIAPLEATLKTEPASKRMNIGLKIAATVVTLLQQLDQQIELGESQAKLNSLINGDEGILKMNQDQIAKLATDCALYNQARLKHSFKFEFISLYFRIPSCEGEPNFSKKENLNADIILSQIMEYDIKPKSLEEKAKEENSNFLLSKLDHLLFPILWAEPARIEHPLLSIKLIPFSVGNVELGTTIERDEKELGLLHRLRMKDEKEIWANTFYQELRAFSVMTGSKL